MLITFLYLLLSRKVSGLILPLIVPIVSVVFCVVADMAIWTPYSSVFSAEMYLHEAIKYKYAMPSHLPFVFVNHMTHNKIGISILA